MSHLDRWYIDLSLVALLTGLAVLAVTADATGVVRIAAVVPLVTLLPGYAFVALLYPSSGNHAVRTVDETQRGLRNPLPSKRGVDTVERVVFAVVSTLVLVPCVALLTSVSPWGLAVRPLLFALAGLTLACTIGGLFRRRRLPAESRYTPQFGQVVSNLGYVDTTSAFGGTDSRRRLYNVGLAASVLLLCSSVGYAAVNPPQAGGFTEFYVDTGDVSGDSQSMYPSQFAVGETRTVPVTIVNQEHERQTYEAVVEIQRVNGTGADADVLESTRAGSQRVSLAHDERRTVEFDVSPDRRGSDRRLLVSLYRGQAPADPSPGDAYRTLRLPITVN
ncbi:DUF1616 domain-containing protein [Haloarcula onubensis]|uniref:DUF1616 domain-containing protein n=1 Tax=Haloarcula onubensis TaxID=2950539 RepID=A0ABU2FQH1_9EURY|nr:DUF1616 domain-containing protein [Halomicroarcula sp. S3CR25-11]MDS0282649.1 DUF1616 domain-containing protein [Halomicroarcula sp. S3CR25-11]